MPTVTLHRGADGKLEGLSDRDKKAYEKFKKRIETIGNGSVLFSWKEPRSGPYHRRFFAIVNQFLESQEQFHNVKHLLEWLKVGAGYCDLVPGPKGKPVAIAKSIAWEELDQAEFEPIAQDIWQFLRSTYATRFLWPMLDDTQAIGAVESVFSVFGE